VTVRPEDLARTLVARHAAEREGWRARAETLRAELVAALRGARAAGRLGRAWLIGSLAFVVD
jgi:hypothetical protein